MNQRKKRVDLRKNRGSSPRQRNLKPLDEGQLESLAGHERVSGKGDFSRRRTIVSASDTELLREVEAGTLKPGRVLSPRGGGCLVDLGEGLIVDCTVRQVLKAQAVEGRTVVAAGDRVLVRPMDDRQGVIEHVEARTGILARKIRERKHVLVTNVDQVLIVGSAATPKLKPTLIDRYLISVLQGGLSPVLVINKIDLVDLAELQPLVGMYSQLGYEVIPCSTRTGRGLARLRHLLKGRATALAGQSGVGKSSLINAVEPGLNLRTLEVTEETGKGQHTTTSARLWPLSMGGWVVDTPGVRQLDLWDVIPEEIEGYFVEFHPYVRACRFANCSHIHERDCGVKQAVARGQITRQRFASYCRIRLGDGDL
ncbi:MAG: ribosome small subunit-dependent GTPase A [Planctomycetaceae bacterium]|jgi:ribosome biogenesis GTPase